MTLTAAPISIVRIIGVTLTLLITSTVVIARFDPNTDLGTMGSTVGVKLSALDYGNAGYSVGGNFDFNGDKYSDVIVGAHATTISGVSNSGRVYIIFGHPGTWSDGSLIPNPAPSVGLSIEGFNSTGFSVAGQIGRAHV